MPRSVPGEGEPVLLILLGDEEHTGAGVVRAPLEEGHHSVMSPHIGEDYSTTRWPMVVKVRRGFSPGWVADRLEDLAASLREREFGFWGEVPEELPEHLRRAAEEDVHRLGVGPPARPVRLIVQRPDEEGVAYRIDVVGAEAAEEGAADETQR